MNETLIAARIVPLIQYFRSHGHATTPIIMTEGTPYGGDWASSTGGNNPPKNIALKAGFDTLVAGGDKLLYYHTTDELFANDLGLGEVANTLVDPTVGGTHLTDLGMRKQASFWSAAIPKVMAAADAERATAAAAGTRSSSEDSPHGTDPSDAYLAKERADSEAYLAEINSMPVAPDGWGAIDHPSLLRAAQLGIDADTAADSESRGGTDRNGGEGGVQGGGSAHLGNAQASTVTVDTATLIMGRRV